MPRRKRNEGLLDQIFNILLVVPTWVGPLLALAFYVGFRFLVPAIFGGDEPGIGTVFAEANPAIAPWIGGLVVALWILAEFQKPRRRC